MLKYPGCDLLPHSCLHFQQQINFSAKVIIYSRLHVILFSSFAVPPQSQPSSLSLWMRIFRHATLLCVNSLCPLLLISFSFEFSLPNILPCPLFSLPCNTPSSTSTFPRASWELSSTNFRLYQWLGLTTPQCSTPQIDEPSDADLLYMAATLEPPHIWSGVRLLKNWGQPWPKQV